MTKLWANFATFHDPTPEDHSWPAYGTDDVTYIRLKDSKIIYEKDTVRDEGLQLWKEMLEKY